MAVGKGGTFPRPKRVSLDSDLEVLTQPGLQEAIENHFLRSHRSWGLEYGANKLGVDKPQDGVEDPNPTEVDILELVAHFSQQLQAFFIVLDQVQVTPKPVP